MLQESHATQRGIEAYERFKREGVVLVDVVRGGPAEKAGIVWLLFDNEAEIVDGLPVFAPPERDVGEVG